jgi:tetratricopeptide (TPR) repeat protein
MAAFGPQRKRTAPLVAAAVLCGAWFAAHLSVCAADGVAGLRLAVGLILALLILVRSKPDIPEWYVDARLLLAVGITGGLFLLLGMAFLGSHLEWIGTLLILFACLAWSLPRRFSRDSLRAVLILYWVCPSSLVFAAPLQNGMHRLSVRAAEWVLQSLDVECWADGQVLHSCSAIVAVSDPGGPKILFTVLPVAAGLAVLLRFRSRDWAVLMLLTALQVIIVDLTLVALLATDSSRACGELLTTRAARTSLCLALVLLEAIILRSRRIAQMRGNTPASVAHRRMPPFWRFIIRRRLPIVVTILVLVAALAVAHKRQPSHRSRMVGGVVVDVAKRDLASGHRAAMAALALDEENHEARTQLTRILLLQGRHEDAAQQLSKVPAGDRSQFHVILNAWTLAGKNGAYAKLSGLPAASKVSPEIAMLCAELAAVRADTRSVVSNLRSAAVSPVMTPRVRALFPFLASRYRWRTIAEVDTEVPHSDWREALIAVSSHLELDNPHEADTVLAGTGAGSALSQGFENAAYAMALADPNGQWGEVLCRKMAGDLSSADAQTLAVYTECAFLLGRREPALTLHNALASRDPAHPELLRAPVRPGSRERGIPATCLDELDRRAARGELTTEMRLMRPGVLVGMGRYGEAHAALLTPSGAAGPTEKQIMLFEDMLLCHVTEDWSGAYESARTYSSAVGRPDLLADLVSIDALLHLDLDAAAVAVAERCARDFPESPDAARALVAAWNAYGDGAYALFLLGKIDRGNEAPLSEHVDLLVEAQRMREARELARLANRPDVVTLPPVRQQLVPVPAEFAIARTFDELPSQKSAEADGSSFAGRLTGVTGEWHESGPGDLQNEIRKWLRVGRDPMEQSVALHRLATLYARRGKYVEADTVAAAALALAPDSAALWRLRISVTGGKDEVVASARRACPEDPEIWLADLVVKVREGSNGTDLVDEIGKTARTARFPIETIVRGGDLLWRKGHPEAAAVAAKHAIERSEGFAPAHVLGLRCAMTLNEFDWAVQCEREIINEIEIDTEFRDVANNDCLTIREGNGAIVRRPVAPQVERPMIPVIDPLAEKWRNKIRRAALVHVSQAGPETVRLTGETEVFEAAYGFSRVLSPEESPGTMALGYVTEIEHLLDGLGRVPTE